jgi:hypothetical protein
MSVPADAPAYVDFCGEVHHVPATGVLAVGREADIAVDDNPYLHRRFLELSFHDGMLWLANVGSTITATVADADGLVQSWLSPGARLPVVFGRTAVWFTAGPTTYELEIVVAEPPFVVSGAGDDAPGGETTMGRVSFTPDQRLLLLALAEDILRRGNRGAGAIPPSAAAAERLGWTSTKFNRKLDNVCEKLAKLGVRGLTSEAGRNASNRRAKLVEYALAARLITVDDLVWLDAVGR